MNWKYHVKIKHLLNEHEDWETVQDTMNKIADILDTNTCFFGFNSKKFRKIPKGDDILGPVDYANKLLNKMFDFTDEKGIWIE